MRISAFPPLLLLCLPLAPAADRLTDQQIEAYIPRLLEPGKRFANIEPAEGVYLRGLVEKVQARRALEIGTSTGYSGIWIAMGLRQTGGKLITLEIDRGRHEAALENFRAVGLADLIDARLGDAVQETPKVEGPLDFVFLDALKSDYRLYYEIVLPKMRKGGVIAAHNVVSNARDMPDFLARIKSDPRVKTEIVTPGWQGISVSFVK
jgi:predicted O-methyltransferase YrrM